MDVLVYERDDGGVTVTTPSERHLAVIMDKYAVERSSALDILASKDVPLTVRALRKYFKKNRSEIPFRQYRDAWKLNAETGEIEHDLSIVRRIRRWRDHQKIQRRLERVNLQIAATLNPTIAARLQSKIAPLEAARAENLKGKTLEQLRNHVPEILKDIELVSTDDIGFDEEIERSVPRDFLPVYDEGQ